jgi:hypothetical protein
MTTTNLTLYRSLVMLGVPETDAASAATVDAADLATKMDIERLRLEIKELEVGLAWKIGTLMVGSMVGLTGIFALIVGWMVRHP